jgi:glycolate oxidase
MRHALVACPNIAAVCEVVGRLLAGPTFPYSIHFDDRHVLGSLAALGYAPPGWDGSDLVRVDWEGPGEELDAAQAALEEMKAVVGAHCLSSEAAETEWQERFRSLRVKRGGPSVVGAEMLLPLPGLRGYLRDVGGLARDHGTKLMTYGHLASADTTIVMTMYYADETKLMAYVLKLGLVKKLYDVGAAHGGVPYGLGFWNAPHLRPQLSTVPLDERRRRKHELDPTGVMNPGKGVAPLALMNPAAIRFGMGAAATVRRMSRGVLR